LACQKWEIYACQLHCSPGSVGFSISNELFVLAQYFFDVSPVGVVRAEGLMIVLQLLIRH